MTFCDHLIEPRSCLEMRCGYLYSYVSDFETDAGKRYMGCMRKVFRGEIEIAAFEEMERGVGFGGIKMTGRPIARCQYRVEPARQGFGPDYQCANPAFFDCESGQGFDLRDLSD